MALPTDAKARKNIPIYSGFVKYFPDAIAEVAELSRKGNDQHNPGKPLHWDRSKSGDELDAQMRHLVDEASGNPTDTDGVLHLTKNAWRAMAALQKALEALRAGRNKPGDLSMFQDDWFTWRGESFEPPCPGAWTVHVQLRSGLVTKAPLAAGSYTWNHENCPSDIVAWRYA